MIVRTSTQRAATHSGFFNRPAIYALAIGFLTFGVSAFGQEFSWIPVDASLPFSIGAGVDSVGEPTEMIVTATSSAIIVEWEMRVNGWAHAPGAPALGYFQGGVNADGFLGINASPSNPGVDLSPLSGIAWQDNQGVSLGGLSDGAHIITQTCEDLIAGSVDLGIPCNAIPATMNWLPCGINPANGNPTFCTPDPEFVFSTNLGFGSVATEVANIVWGGVSSAGVCTADDGVSSYYVGTLILGVPGGATGTYSFGFDPAQTFMNDCAGNVLPGVTLTPGHVTLETGACCNLLGGGATSCTDFVLAENCPNRSGGPSDSNNPLWNAGMTCPDVDAAGGCPSCIWPVHCDDGNACTDDDCVASICMHDDNFNAATECCDTPSPGVRSVTLIDDGDFCTVDSCVAGVHADGSVAVHDPTAAAGFACDDGVIRTCPDVCDGVNSQANGGCVGPDITTHSCTTDADCCIGLCDGTGRCGFHLFGACCVPSGPSGSTCSIIDQADCDAAGGTITCWNFGADECDCALDTDGDGTVNPCDDCTDTDGDGFGDPGFPANTCPDDPCPGIDDSVFMPECVGAIPTVSEWGLAILALLLLAAGKVCFGRRSATA